MLSFKGVTVSFCYNIMTSVVREKNLTCIAWTMKAPPVSSYRNYSDYFVFRDRRCRFFIDVGVETDTTDLHFESDSQLYPAVDAIISVRDSTSKKYPLGRSLITGGDQTIWSVQNVFLHRLFTFEVIIQASTFKGKQQEVIDEKHVAQESQTLDSSPNIHLEALSRDFSKLLDKSARCDVGITCDGKTFNVHKIVLESRSAVFAAMLGSNMVENETGIIKIEDTEACVFQSFLYYLYSGVLPELNVETAEQLYEVADKYAVEELKNASSEFLTKNLSESNAYELLVLADQHSDHKFREEVITYMVGKELPRRTSCWRDFCSSHTRLAIEVLNVYIEKISPK